MTQRSSSRYFKASPGIIHFAATLYVRSGSIADIDLAERDAR